MTINGCSYFGLAKNVSLVWVGGATDLLGAIGPSFNLLLLNP
jgi:hypothetical protein